jgi:hypothetical protein
MSRAQPHPVSWRGRSALLGLGLLAVAGCRFDPSGIAPTGGPYKDGSPLEWAIDLVILDAGPDVRDPTDAVIIRPPDVTFMPDGPLPYLPSNVGPNYWALGTGVLTVSKTTPLTIDTTYNTSSGGSLPAGVALWGVSSYALLTLKDLTVEKDATLNVQGQRPLVVIASGKVIIDGMVNLAASGKSPGPGGFFGGPPGGAGAGCGGGYSGADKGDTAGAPGGSFGGKGGRGGGDGPLGKLPCLPTCSGPFCYNCLTPLVGGSGGGGAADPWPITGGDGGAGGGAIQISAYTSIHVKKGGKIHTGGGGGEGGSAGAAAGGGGGSGGGILLEAPLITIDGIVAANGGGGGGGGTLTTTGDSGTDGQPSGTRANGGDGGSVAFVSDGGDGGKGSGTGDDQQDGEDGTTGSGMAHGEGGGGGGSGRICVRATTFNQNTPIISPYTNANSHAFTYLPLPP